LAALAAFLAGRGCIVRHGRLVYTWGDIARRGDIASAAKPVITHFLLKAIEDGRIASLDDPVVAVEPRLAEINAHLAHKDRRITWRHMASQTSCYGVTEEPGTAFDYNDWQIALLWDCLFLKVYGATYETVDTAILRPLLTDILQCQDEPTMLAFGLNDRPGRMAISPRDFARFGLLYLREGNWNGRQRISREHARLATASPLPASLPRTAGVAAEMIPGQRTKGSNRMPDNQTDHFGSYSYLWWVNGVDASGVRMMPDAPVDTYMASGHNSKRVLMIIPSLDMVISWNDAAIDRHTNGPDSPVNQAMNLLMAAVKDQ
jgi:CubicO group peptidase (beta-lactamase class C family)